VAEKKPYAKPTVTSRPIQPGDIDAGARFAERRATPRYALIAPTEIVEPIANVHLTGRTAEIGLGGCYVDVTNPLPKGTIVQLSIQRDQGVLKIWGRVVYAHENIGMGVQFFNIEPPQHATLKTWIDELSSSEWTTL